MTFTFDGTDIFKHSQRNMDAWAEWNAQNTQQIHTLLHQDVKSPLQIAREWDASDVVPVAYKGAKSSTLRKIDAEAAQLLETWAKEWGTTGQPRNVFITSRGSLTGKTWTSYVWIRNLIREGVLTNPQEQVFFCSEEHMVSSLNLSQTADDFRRRLINGGKTKLVVLDPVDPNRLHYRADTVKIAGLKFIDIIQKLPSVGLTTVISNSDTSNTSNHMDMYDQNGYPLRVNTEPSTEEIYIQQRRDGSHRINHPIYGNPYIDEISDISSLLILKAEIDKTHRVYKGFTD